MCWWWRISGLGIVSGGLMCGRFRTSQWLNVLVLAVAAGVGEVVVACWQAAVIKTAVETRRLAE